MEELPEEIRQLLWQYKDVFKEKVIKGRTMDIPPVELRIDKSKERPEECIHPRPVPAHWKKQHDKILDYLEEAKLIEKLDSTEGFLSPSFCVAKPSDVLTLRLVIDYSHINHLIERPGQVTPSCDKVIRKMGEGNRYFLTLDFSSGYWQIPVAKE